MEKFRAWTDWEHRTFTDDDLLDNLMLYWLPGTGASSARLYWESFKAVQQRFAGETTDEVSVPVGGTVFPKEIPGRRGGGPPGGSPTCGTGASPGWAGTSPRSSSRSCSSPRSAPASGPSPPSAC
ncbi:hypothetical protein [Dactylosporangium cerinum]